MLLEEEVIFPWKGHPAEEDPGKKGKWLVVAGLEKCWSRGVQRNVVSARFDGTGGEVEAGMGDVGESSSSAEGLFLFWRRWKYSRQRHRGLEMRKEMNRWR